MIGIVARLWVGTFGIGVVGCCTLAAQSPRPGAATAVRLAKDLRNAEPGIVEVARRRLCAVAVADLPEHLLIRDALDPSAPRHTRVAAVDILLHHNRRIDVLGPSFADERDDAVRIELLRCLSAQACASVVADDENADVARVAFERLVELAAVGESELLAALVRKPRDVDETAVDAAAQSAADWMVRHVSPLPIDVLATIRYHPSARDLVLHSLSQRPRKAAVPWLLKLLAELPTTGHPEAEDRRVQISLAFPVGMLPANEARKVVRAAAQASMSARLGIASRLSAKVADRLVADVHRLLTEGVGVGDVLPLLHRVSPGGERHFLALSRVANDAQREEIVQWLALRGPDRILEVVAAVFDEQGDGVELAMLRRAGPLLRLGGDRAVRIRSVLHRALADPERPIRRHAAFKAFVRGKVYDPQMIEHVLRAGLDHRKRSRRLRALLSIPFERIPSATWHRLIGHPEDDLAAWVLQQLADRRSMLFDFEDELIARSRAPSSRGIAAFRLLSANGRGGAVQALWHAAEPAVRERVVSAFERRRDPWVRQLLRADPAGETPRFELTRLRLGEVEVFERLVKDPTRWPLQWFRRASEDLSDRLEPRHVVTIAQHLVGPKSLADGYRLELLDVLTARDDLDSGRLLLRLVQTDEDPDIRERAFAALIGRPAGRPLRDRISAGIGAPFDEDQEDSRHAYVGSLTSPVSAENAALLARILLVGPLGNPDQEILAHLDDTTRGAPGVVLTNMAAQLLRRGADTEALGPAFEAAADAALAHPSAYASGRARSGALLLDAARLGASRLTVGSPIARAILASPDRRKLWLGPAWLLLAESHAAADRFAAAATAFEQSARFFTFYPPAPFVRSVFLPPVDPAVGQNGLAWLAAQPALCRARAAVSAGDLESARRELRQATDLAEGDLDAESLAMTILEQVTPR